MGGIGLLSQPGDCPGLRSKPQYILRRRPPQWFRGLDGLPETSSPGMDRPFSLYPTNDKPKLGSFDSLRMAHKT